MMPSKSSKISFDDAELVRDIQAKTDKIFELYKTQREDFLDIWKINDYMVRAGQNETIRADERARGAGLDEYDDDDDDTSSDETELANTGSTLMFRMMSQLASRGVAVQKSRPSPFKYTPVINERIFRSKEEADEQADQWNVYARWVAKQDKLNIKSIEFWHALVKYGNLPVMMTMAEDRRRVMVSEPVYRSVQGPTGETRIEVDEIKHSKKNLIVKSFPSIEIMTIDSIYADILIPSIENQDVVIVVSTHPRHFFWSGARNGFFDKDQIAKIDKTHVWDGQTNRDLAQTRMDNQKIESPLENVTDQYLTFDIFFRCPIDDDGEWNDEEVEPELYWFTVVGNTIADGVMIRIDRMIDVDPDDEIPIAIIHDLPDDNDILYHLSRGQIIRSNYSVECTLKNQAIDTGTAINRPPIIEREGGVRGDDRRYKPGAHWIADMPIDEAIKEFQIKNTVPNSIDLLEWISKDSRMALGVDKNDLGESFGARTSSNEASIISRSNTTPQLITINYVMDQLWTFYARKFVSYTKAFSIPEQLVAVTDDDVEYSIRPARLFGEFDVVVDIVDEYEDGLLEVQALNDFMRLVGEFPVYGANVDFAELLIEYAKKRHLDYSKFVRPPMDEDARETALEENKVMIHAGVIVAPRPGQNHDIHLAEHEGERLRYKGIEDEWPTVRLLDTHIEQTKFLKRQAQPTRTASGTAPTENTTEGMAQGNQIAAAAGAQVPQ